jgi:hypothetical protein
VRQAEPVWFAYNPFCTPFTIRKQPFSICAEIAVLGIWLPIGGRQIAAPSARSITFQALIRTRSSCWWGTQSLCNHHLPQVANGHDPADLNVYDRHKHNLYRKAGHNLMLDSVFFRLTTVFCAGSPSVLRNHSTPRYHQALPASLIRQG